VAPSIKEKFNALRYTFDTVCQNLDISDAQDRYSGAEIDILLGNGDIAIAVEVKPQHKDVDRHVERMEALRLQYGRTLYSSFRGVVYALQR
jgi:Holliday junction resolvase-like predicted endonuclease